MNTQLRYDYLRIFWWNIGKGTKKSLISFHLNSLYSCLLLALAWCRFFPSSMQFPNSATENTGMKVTVVNLGCNSIDTLNFVPKTGRKTSPRTGPHSVLGHYTFIHVSKLQKWLGPGSGPDSGTKKKCLLNCSPEAKSLHHKAGNGGPKKTAQVEGGIPQARDENIGVDVVIKTLCHGSLVKIK